MATEKRNADAWLKRATDLLAESLAAWEDEEDSVKEEKADHIAELTTFFDAWTAGIPNPPRPA